MIRIALCILLTATFAAAQDTTTPAVEVFGGYSYMRNTSNDVIFGEDISLHGWNANAAFNVSPWLGIVGDVSGHYGDLFLGFVNVNQHLFLGGPRLSLRRERFTPFAQALFGVARTSVVGVSENDFAMTFGGGLDVKLSDSIAVRPFQAEYRLVRFSSDVLCPAPPCVPIEEKLHGLRLSVGLVLRLGSR